MMCESILLAKMDVSVDDSGEELDIESKLQYLYQKASVSRSYAQSYQGYQEVETTRTGEMA